jgi:hypothetical protein
MTKIFIIETTTSVLRKFETNIQNFLTQITNQKLFCKKLSVKKFRSHMHTHLWCSRYCHVTDYRQVFWLITRFTELCTSNVSRRSLPSNSSSTVVYLRSCCLPMTAALFVLWSLPTNGSIYHVTYLATD